MCAESVGVPPLIHPVVNNPAAEDSNVYQASFSLFHLLSLWFQSGVHWIQRNQINDFKGRSISCRTEIRLLSQHRQMSEQGERQHHPQPWHPCMEGGVEGRGTASFSPSRGKANASALLPIPKCPPAGFFQALSGSRKETLLCVLYTASPSLGLFCTI